MAWFAFTHFCSRLTLWISSVPQVLNLCFANLTNGEAQIELDKIVVNETGGFYVNYFLTHSLVVKSHKLPISILFWKQKSAKPSQDLVGVNG